MAGEHKKSMRLGSMFSEIIPLASFFIVNQSHGLYMGALAALVTALLLIVVFWVIEKRLARFVVFSTLISGILTVTALMTAEKLFIKIQPSLFSFAFAAVLLGGAMRRLAVMKVFFKTQFDLPDRVWWQLSLRWGVFFLLAGTANEIAWRQLSDDDWVTFRVFVMAPATGLFMLAQLPLTLYGLRANRDERLAAQLSERQHGETHEKLSESDKQH
ncbi:MAG: septation protein IspZ [Pseudomonadota bacterium]|nr:septation protein IspZ [Pseudomonadota bacterium]|tara:strand:- start:143 stop:787 length:645 start_codon:yes stop_codon:yes gene_type:complete